MPRFNNVTTDWGKPLVTFGYETQEEAKSRRTAA
jgi:hypothetical protein